MAHGDPASPGTGGEPLAGRLSSLAPALVRVARRQDPVRWALGGVLAAWSLTLFHLGRLRHERFGTFGFDLGIYDQGVWLLSELREPFVTVRGMDLFGHHTNLALWLVAPFYRLGAGPELLLAVQIASQAAGAVAVYLLARDLLEHRWPAVGLAAVLLLNPTYQWLIWEYFHPDALAIGPLLFAYWAARAHRWGWFTLAALLAAACKEDVALALVVLGVLVAVRGHRRIGVAVAAAAALWFAIATRVLIPRFTDGMGPFYEAFFGDLGDSPGEIARNVVTRPADTFRLVTESDRLSYYVRILAPFAFVPVLAPQVLALGLPMLAVNALTEYPHTRDFRFHYSSIVVAAAMVATVEVVARYRADPPRVRAAVGALLGAALVTSVAWGISPLSVEYRSGYWPHEPHPRQDALATAIATVPDDASTSAIYNLVPHLTHRNAIYEFPVPWRNVNWGVRGEGLHDPATVEWIVVDRTRLGEEDLALLDRLLDDEFTERFARDDVVVAERVAAPADRRRQPLVR